MNRRAAHAGSIAVSSKGNHSINEVDRVALRQRHRIPAQLIRRRINFAERTAAQLPHRQRSETSVHYGWTNLVQPTPQVFMTQCQKRTTAELLGIQAVRSFLRGILSFWKRAFDSLARKMIGKTGLIAE